MTCKRILVATDFSPPSKAALAYATALARQWDALLLIVHVEEVPADVTVNEHLLPSAYPNPLIRRLLEAVAPTDPCIRHEHRLIPGVAAEVIPRLAEEEQVDLIVMGTHGRSGVSRLLMGSVAETVVRRARCPVLTLKCPQASGRPTTTPDRVAAGNR